MISSTDTILNESCWILPFEPDWQKGVETRFTIPTGSERGLTGRESRRAFASKLRCEMEFSSLLTPAEVADLRNAMQGNDFATTPIWFPFWPGQWRFEPGYGSRFSSAQAVVRISNTDASLQTDPENLVGPYPVYTWIVPALRGFFVEPPSINAIGSNLYQVKFWLREDGPPELALQVNASAFTAGPQISGRDYNIFPFNPNWTGRIQTGSAVIETDGKEIGFNREQALAVYPQLPERPLRFDLSLHSNREGADLIGFYSSQEGNTGPFWCPTWVSEAPLVSDGLSGASSLAVSNGLGIGDNGYIAVVDQLGQTEVKAVSSKTAESIVLDGSLDGFHPKDTSYLTTAALARFNRSGLTLAWQSPEEVKTSVQVKEVAYDYYSPTGEVHGESIGTLGKTCFLYRFSIAYPSTTKAWHFTSFEEELTFDGETWLPKPVEHGDIRETLNLERNEVRLQTRAFTDNPLLKFIPFRLEFPLKLEIFEANLLPNSVTPTGQRRIFSGEVTRVSFDGPFITARAVTVGNMFERKIPRVLLQPTCNYALFDGACGLNKDSWKYSGFVTAVLENPTRLQLKALTRVSGTWVQPDSHWFAGGWVELGTGEEFESRFIADATSYNPTGEGFIEITLSTPLNRTPEMDEEIFLFPGCDGKKGTCSAKFGNYNAFGGFPHMPVGNPSMVKMPANRNMK